MTRWVWVQGQVLGADRARVSALDRGLLFGEGVFESVTINDGQPFAFTRHICRLRRSAAIIGLDLPFDDDHIRGATAAVLAAAQGQPEAHKGKLRITVTAGPDLAGPQEPTLTVMLTGQSEWGENTSVAISPWPISERSPIVGAKTISRLEYSLALRAAQASGADEAVIVNTAGVLTEGSSSNLFLVVAGRLSTPALSTGCLGGVTRDLIIESVEVAERDDLTVDDLRLATEAFLTSTTRGVHPIASVDGKALRSVPGPLTSAAAAAYGALRATTLDP